VGAQESTDELVRRLIEAMPGGVVQVGADGSIQAANAEALRILGYSYDAATKRYTHDWSGETLREDGSPCPVEDYPVSRAMMTGQAQPPMTIGIRQPGGELCWAVFTAVPLRDADQVTGAVVTFLDVTAQRQSEARLRSILESAPNFIVSADRDGRITYTNRLLPGLTYEQTYALHAWDFVAPEDQDRVRKAFAKIIETGLVLDYEAGGTGATRYQVGAGPIRVGDEIVGVTFIAWDVTRQKELETQVAVSDRLATIGTLVAGVAHEINNPLTYLLANLEWLQRAAKRGVSGPREEVALAAALEGALRIRDVVRDLGSLSRVDADRVALLDVRELLDAALRMADHEIRVRARVRRHYEPVPPVLANESRLGQVFLNLAVNAAQAIPEGDVDRHEIGVSTRLDGDRVIVEIRDSGAGIPPELMSRVFEPFVTTKPAGMGTGLGLHIARSIVTSVGGEIAIDSTVDVGTTVRVSLPVASAAQASSAPAAAARGAPTGRLRVLVMDDEPQLTRVIETLLGGEHAVTSANSGRTALALLVEHRYDLVLCDLIMPELTGMDVYEEVARRDPAAAARIVFMTGGAFTERARSFLAAHDNPVLAKPFSLEDLQALIKRYGR
jgi:PAS domain S-box-containing protein